MMDLIKALTPFPPLSTFGGDGDRVVSGGGSDDRYGDLYVLPARRSVEEGRGCRSSGIGPLWVFVGYPAIVAIIYNTVATGKLFCLLHS